MGQCFNCVSASLHVAPEVFAPDGLPKDIIHLTENSDPALLNEFVDVFAYSFCGSTESPPEAALSWSFDPASSGDNPSGLLTCEPSEARIKYFKFIAGFAVHSALRHGGCFALQKDDGKIAAAAVTFPPNHKRVHRIGTCEQMQVVDRMGGWTKVASPEIQGGDSEKRLSKVSETMEKYHDVHAPGLHIYVLAFATLLGEQGKGYGKQLMTFLTESANRMVEPVPLYLECSGQKNERFYERNGFKVVKRYPIEFKNQAFDPDGLGGLSAMYHGLQ